jgi:serine/threonine-protein kinase
MTLSPLSNSSLTLTASLRDSPLLTHAQQAELVRDLQPRFPDSKLLARQLLERGWLTTFQVNQLFLGRGADLVLGPYVLLERLGEGGTGQLFKARHQHMNRVVAVKLIRKELLADREVVGRFHREIQLVSTLSHSNVVHAYDAGPVGANYFLVMEYLEGIDLAQKVKKEGPLPVELACEYVRQTALGLQYICDRGLIHRDIKPSNLFLATAAPTPPVATVKILDLGLARLQQPVHGETTRDLTSNGDGTLGTLDYLAPEQAIDFHAVDIRADIYSLGCTFYQLLCGQPPFPAGTVAQKLMKHQQAEPVPLETRRGNLPPTLTAVIRRMMAKEPAQRFQTPGEVARLFTSTASPVAANLPAAVGRQPQYPIAVIGPPLPAPRNALVIDVEAVPARMRFPTQKLVAFPRAAWKFAWRHPRPSAVCLALLVCLVAGLYLFRGGSAAKGVPGKAAEDGPLTYLSDLPEMNFQGGAFGKNGRLGHNGNGNIGGAKVDELRIIVKGAASRKGLSMLAPSVGAAQVQYRLGKQYQQFKGTVALHDGGWFSGSAVTFLVLGDGNVLWRSKPIRVHGDYPQECSVSVAGVDLLELQVTCTSSNNGVWPVWLDPCLSK